jgi:hypothetical protein
MTTKIFLLKMRKADGLLQYLFKNLANYRHTFCKNYGTNPTLPWVYTGKQNLLLGT